MSLVADHDTAGHSADRRARLLADIEFGRDGFLFLRGDASFAQLCDAATLNERDERRLLGLLNRRGEWCAARGIPYVVLIVPEKQVIYDDMLPAGRVISPRRPAARLLDGLSAAGQAGVIYPEQALRDGRAVLPTYYRTDQHWSRWGAYLGYRALVEQLNCRFRNMPGLLLTPPITEEALVMADEQMIGDLGVRLDPEPVEQFRTVMPRAPLRFRKHALNRCFTDGQVDLFQHDDRRLPRGVVFRSSNATHLLDPFLASHFSRLIAVAGGRDFFQDLIEAERPDCVITELPERYLAVPLPPGGPDRMIFPPDLVSLSFVQRTGLSLPLG